MIPSELEQRISQLKKRHPALLHTTGPSLDNEGLIHIICRTLSVSEMTYHGEVSYRDQEAAQEFVVKIATLEVFEEDTSTFLPVTDLPIGLFNDVYEIVLENSGIGDPYQLAENLNLYRSISGTPNFQATAFICKAFSRYTPQDVENMSVMELAKNIVLAELIHDSPFQIVTEEEMRKQAQKQESGVMNSIRKEATTNDKVMGGRRKQFMNFSEENSDLNQAMN